MTKDNAELTYDNGKERVTLRLNAQLNKWFVIYSTLTEGWGWYERRRWNGVPTYHYDQAVDLYEAVVKQVKVNNNGE